MNIVLAALTVFSLFVWQIVNPNSFDNFADKPYLLVFPIIYLLGLVGLFFIKRIKKELHGFILSTLLIVGGITSSLASIFPVILPSINDVHKPLTIYNTSASEYGLSVALTWGIIGCILVVVYMIIQKRLTGGKVDKMDYGH